MVISANAILQLATPQGTIVLPAHPILIQDIIPATVTPNAATATSSALTQTAIAPLDNGTLQQLCEAGGEEFNAACAELMRRCQQNGDAEACRLISDYNQRLGELCRAGDQSACRTLLNRCNAGDKDYSDPNSACKQRSTCTPERETELNQQIMNACAFPRGQRQCSHVERV